MFKKIPLKPNQINVDKIIFKKVKKLSDKKIIPIKYLQDGAETQLVFQTCTLYNKLKPKKFNNYWEFNIPLSGKNNEKVNQLTDFLIKLNQKIIKDSQLHKTEWFGENTNSIQYRNIINESDSDEKIWANGSISFKIPIKQASNFQTTLLENKKNIRIEDIKENNMIKSALEIYLLIIKDNDFYIYMRPIILSFNKLNDLINYNYDLIDSDSEEEEKDLLETEAFNSLFIKHKKIDTELEIETALFKISKSSISTTTSSDELQKIIKLVPDLYLNE